MKYFALACDKDEELAVETQAIEQDESLLARQSRELIKEKIETRYTKPA